MIPSSLFLWARRNDPGQIQDRLPGMVGRKGEIPRILELLDQDDGGVVTLLGSGGVGKSRLALAAAARIAPTFAHGACFVSLESVIDPGMVPKAIAQALGIRESVSERAPDLLLDVLADRHMLLVLDGLQHVKAAAPWIESLKERAPRLRLLITSRAPLHIRGAQEIVVPPLDVSVDSGEAVDLFLDRARTADPDFHSDEETAHTIAGICRMLGGIPLAIEIAAMRMRGTAPSVIADELEGLGARHPDLLNATTIPLSEVIGWSYDRLSHEAQVLVCRLSRFVGGFSPEAAEYAAAYPESPRSAEEGHARIGTLVEQGLVHAMPGAAEPLFRMPEAVREFARSQFAVDDDFLAGRAHAEYYWGLAERTESDILGKDQARALELLDREYPNIRLAMGWFEDNDALQRAISIESRIQFFVSIRGHAAEELERLTRWLESSLTLPNTPERGLALMVCGRLHQNAGNLEWSIAMLTEAAAIFQAENDARHTAMARTMLAVSYWLIGLEDEMVELAEAALDITVPLKMHRSTSAALSVLAVHARRHGDHVRAAALREEVVRIATAAGDRWGMGFGLGSQAREALDAGDLETAWRTAEELRLLLEELGALQDLPDVWHLLARVARKRGDVHTASECLATASSLAISSGNRKKAASFQMLQGIVEAEAGRLHDAARLLAGSLGTWPSASMPLIDLAETLDAYAALAAHAGELVAAARFLGASSHIARQSGGDAAASGFAGGGYMLNRMLSTELGAEVYDREYAIGAGWDAPTALLEARAFTPSPIGEDERAISS